MSQAQIALDAVRGAVKQVEKHGLEALPDLLQQGMLAMMVSRGNLLHSPLALAAGSFVKEKTLLDSTLRYGALLVALILRHGGDHLFQTISADVIVRSALCHIGREVFPRKVFVEAARFFLQNHAGNGENTERVAQDLKRIGSERLAAECLVRDVSIDDALALLQ